MFSHVRRWNSFWKDRIRRNRGLPQHTPDIPLKVENLRYNFTSEAVSLQVPLVGQIAAKLKPSTQQEHLDDHLSWRIYMEPWKDGGHGSLLKTSVKELKIVESAFPLVSNPEAILAMAAWFATLLLVDDLIENMDLNDARQALADSVQILSGTHVTISEETNKPVVRVCHVIRSLRARISQLLGHGSAIAMLRDIKACLEGQMDELRYRSSPCTSLQEYSRIRHRSIGAMPFLTLVALQLAHDSSARANRSLFSLKELVVSIVFLQNDLVGLEKDLKEDVSMNAFMVMRQSRGSSTIPTSDDLAELSAQHNALVSKALFMYRRDAGQNGSDGYTLAAASIVSFIETHLTWARKSKRTGCRRTYDSVGLAGAAPDANVDVFAFGGAVNLRGCGVDATGERGWWSWSWAVLKGAAAGSGRGAWRSGGRIRWVWRRCCLTLSMREVRARSQIALARDAFGRQLVKVDEALPGPGVQSAEQVRDYSNDSAWGHHCPSTCPIGTRDDPMAVLDSKLGVRGVRGLRIVDASVCPRIPGTFTAVSTYMVGDKAADVILERR